MEPNSPPAPPGARKATRCTLISTRSRIRRGPAASSRCSTARAASLASRRSSRGWGSRRNNRVASATRKAPDTRGLLFFGAEARRDSGRLFALERRFEQAELTLDRIARPRPRRVRTRMHGGVEPAHRGLERLRARDEIAQTFGQKLDVVLVAELGRRELDLGFFLAGLGERHLAFLDRAVQQ